MKRPPSELFARPAYQVAYRQGGPDRFRWQLVLVNYQNKAEALSQAAIVERQGYKALVSGPEGFRHGLPDTWSAKDSPADFELRRGWYYRILP